MLGYAEHIRDPILHNHVVLHVIEELVADGAFDHGRMVAAKHLRPVPSLDGIAGIRVTECCFAISLDKAMRKSSLQFGHNALLDGIGTRSSCARAGLL